ncbi:MAG: hypothetical protein P8176_16555 [Gammaproteobacteria bacterium]
MKRIISGLVVIIVLITLSAKDVRTEDQVKNVEQPARYVLSEKNIVSWKENERWFSIKLIPEGQKKFFILTRDNVNKPLRLYVGVFLVGTPIVREAIGSGSMILSADVEEKKDKIHALLPSLKKV